ncbi:MAG TPA: heme-binding domain-containing protein, partial [Iamia sp.]|nr:heme-binding domain-containing protein [Iamia sp.]
VDGGREALNFSEWGEEDEAHDAAEEVTDGAMPPSQYTMIHRGARLTDEEAAILIDALEQMDDGGRGRGRGGDDEDGGG